jgi:glutamyl-tRNA reductase
MDTDLYIVGISHEKANQEIRSKYSLTVETIKKILFEAKNKGINSLVVLTTCNRTEIIGYVPHPFIIIELLDKYTNGSIDELSKYIYIYKEERAMLHLFELTAGIKSQILGDYEIVNQLKTAFKISKNSKILDTYLERLFNQALQSSKEIKNLTNISGGTTSTSYAGIRYLKDKFGSLRDKNIAVLGLGDIGKSTLKNLIQYSDANHIIVINRTKSKAEAFIKPYKKVKVGDFDNLKNELKNQDILFVCSNAPKPIITVETLNANSNLTIIDLSIPSNVAKEVVNISTVDLIKLDNLSNITNSTFEARKKEIPKAKKIIHKHLLEYQSWLAGRKITPVLNSLKEALQNLKKGEIKAVIKDNPEQKEIVNAVTDKIFQKIINRYAYYLKNNPKSVNRTMEIIKEVYKINSQ